MHVDMPMGDGWRSSAERWDAVVGRNTAADGSFIYGVTTTGVYCRPSCPSRLARREHVTFYSTVHDAQRAGFRPCKRCQPDGPTTSQRHARWVAAMCRSIEASDRTPTLAVLSRQVGLSAHHAHRLFKSLTGLTPVQYGAAQRAKRMRSALASSASVTSAIYGAGYGSSGRFYERAHATLGMTAKQYRDGGAHLSIRFAIGECSLGSILVASTARGVCCILLGDEPLPLAEDLERRFPAAALVGADSEFESVVARVVGWVDASDKACDLPLDIQGTAFQQRVWLALTKIPAGRTATYSEIACAIGAPKAARAVARACAANPLAVAIPCHRVVRADGSLSGYRWGVQRKRLLLEREAKCR